MDLHGSMLSGVTDSNNFATKERRGRTDADGGVSRSGPGRANIDTPRVCRNGLFSRNPQIWSSGRSFVPIVRKTAARDGQRSFVSPGPLSGNCLRHTDWRHSSMQAEVARVVGVAVEAVRHGDSVVVHSAEGPDDPLSQGSMRSRSQQA